jgi:hypothetical protein
MFRQPLWIDLPTGSVRMANRSRLRKRLALIGASAIIVAIIVLL